jgi:hypothetical protein
MLVDERYFAVIVTLLTSFGWFWMSAPAWVLNKVEDFVSDKVNLLNIVCANIAFLLKLVSATSAILALLTPIVVGVSAIVVLAYNVIKLLKSIRDLKKD